MKYNVPVMGNVEVEATSEIEAIEKVEAAFGFDRSNPLTDEILASLDVDNTGVSEL